MSAELMGPYEIARAGGVHMRTARRWMALEGFPAPIADLHMGPVYLASDVRAWIRRRAADRRRRRVF